jgi:hypothetical protein
MELLEDRYQRIFQIPSKRELQRKLEQSQGMQSSSLPVIVLPHNNYLALRDWKLDSVVD